MKKLLFVLFIGFFGVLYAQTIDSTNVRPGESIEYCTSHKKLQELLKDPEYKRQFESEQAQLLQEEKIHKATSRKRGTVYIIPVVFHILHSGGVENVSDDQIFDAMAILNRDFRLLNEDAKTVHSDFKNLPTDVEIEFRLATIAPNGACFNGITRTYTTDTTTNGNKQVTLIKNGNNVYKGEWTGNKYMHVFICKALGGSAGYTYRPQGSGNNMTNGIWILHNYVGSIGSSSVRNSRALTHEVGHWLNLMHTWGGNNNPGNITSCSDLNQDQVDDTPPTIGVTWCNLEENSCGSRANVENYMDYSYCSKMFTPGQVSRMRTAIQSSIGGRSNIWSSNNLKSVGVTTPKLCSADFKSDKTTICIGNEVAFKDLSFNNVTSWSWTFEGGTPSTSSEKDPKVIYSKPGFYNVSLTVSNGASSLTVKKDSLIYVFTESQPITYLESFKYNSLTDNKFWEIGSDINNQSFQIYKSTGHTDDRCIMLRNFVDKGKNTDQIISGNFDLSSVTNENEITIQFRYSYAKLTNTTNELLRLSISNDCGKTWSVRKSSSSTSLTDNVLSTEWYPSNKSDWRTFTYTGIPSNYWTKDFRIKIDFQGNGGNNLFIDDINIYPFAPSEEIVGVINNDLYNNSIQLSPNPVDELLSIKLSNGISTVFNYQILDLTGKIIQTEFLNQTQDLFQIETNKLIEGSYMLRLQTNVGSITKHFVVK